MPIVLIGRPLLISYKSLLNADKSTIYNHSFLWFTHLFLQNSF